MSELVVGSIAGLAANDYVVSVASGSKLVQPGSVLQVVNADYSTQTVTTSSSFVSTNLSATITPTSASNKIVVIYSGAGSSEGAADNYIGTWTLFRGTTSGTNLGDVNNGITALFVDGSSPYRIFGAVGFTLVDTPNTTSAQEYTVGFRVSSGGTAYANLGNRKSTLTLMEIAG